MRNKQARLIEARSELKSFITGGMETTFPAILFNVVGTSLTKVFGLTNKPHWIVSAIVINAIIFLPGSLVSVGTGETAYWKREHLLFLALQPFAFMSSIVSHVNMTHNVLPGIRDHIVDSILSIEDIYDLKKWLNVLFSFRKWLVFSFVVGISAAYFFVLGLRLVVEGPITGIAIATYFVIPFLIAPLYVIFHMLRFPSRLAGYHLDIYESDPVNSEVIQRLIYILNVYLYMVVGYIAVGTLLSSLTPATIWWVWTSIVLAWLPTILQFLINQYSVRKMVISAKWRILNQLQKQIRQLQTNIRKDAPDKTIDDINQLMDLHERIAARPNSMLNWGTGLSFLNQLMLPILGLLLGNLDNLLLLLGRSP